jgi:hypothetical protein
MSWSPLVIAVLVNPSDPARAETTSKELQAAAHSLGLQQLHVLHASTERDFDTVFASLVQLRAGGLVIGGEPFFNSRSEQLGELTMRHAVPTVYQLRTFAAAGGLASYGGANLAELYRLVGVYTGRILKGEKPADLPVQLLDFVVFPFGAADRALPIRHERKYGLIAHLTARAAARRWRVPWGAVVHNTPHLVHYRHRASFQTPH